MKILVGALMCVSAIFAMPPADRRSNGLPRFILDHPAAAYRSDTIGARLADADERLNLRNREISYDIPNEQRFRSLETISNYDDTDDDITHDTFNRQLRHDDVNGPSIRKLDRKVEYANPISGQAFRDLERGDHVIDTNGDNSGLYARRLALQDGELAADLRRDIDYRNRGEGFIDNDDGVSLPGRDFFINAGRFAPRDQSGNIPPPSSDWFGGRTAIVRPRSPFEHPEGSPPSRFIVGTTY
ncbi:PREDICTED: uncharacterized protein LOC106809674 [Priapulus caudatus]|uniref:Uncharacterized protein LOC106809674 n=1 Tax=Priapulus caudatus TaxID=37621 RepID=A0ABM1E803_PRICU|nr:PREDICTED: uncharacterized protein LOC106809674 [Priapulus caudatus]